MRRLFCACIVAFAVFAVHCVWAQQPSAGPVLSEYHEHWFCAGPRNFRNGVHTFERSANITLHIPSAASPGDGCAATFRCPLSNPVMMLREVSIGFPTVTLAAPQLPHVPFAKQPMVQVQGSFGPAFASSVRFHGDTPSSSDVLALIECVKVPCTAPPPAAPDAGSTAAEKFQVESATLVSWVVFELCIAAIDCDNATVAVKDHDRNPIVVSVPYPNVDFKSDAQPLSPDTVAVVWDPTSNVANWSPGHVPRETTDAMGFAVFSRNATSQAMLVATGDPAMLFDDPASLVLTNMTAVPFTLQCLAHRCSKQGSFKGAQRTSTEPFQPSSFVLPALLNINADCSGLAGCSAYGELEMAMMREEGGSGGGGSGAPTCATLAWDTCRSQIDYTLPLSQRFGNRLSARCHSTNFSIVPAWSLSTPALNMTPQAYRCGLDLQVECFGICNSPNRTHTADHHYVVPSASSGKALTLFADQDGTDSTLGHTPFSWCQFALRCADPSLFLSINVTSRAGSSLNVGFQKDIDADAKPFAEIGPEVDRGYIQDPITGLVVQFPGAAGVFDVFSQAAEDGAEDGADAGACPECPPSPFGSQDRCDGCDGLLYSAACIDTHSITCPPVPPLAWAAGDPPVVKTYAGLIPYIDECAYDFACADRGMFGAVEVVLRGGYMGDTEQFGFTVSLFDSAARTMLTAQMTRPPGILFADGPDVFMSWRARGVRQPLVGEYEFRFTCSHTRSVENATAHTDAGDVQRLPDAPADRGDGMRAVWDSTEALIRSRGLRLEGDAAAPELPHAVNTEHTVSASCPAGLELAWYVDVELTDTCAENVGANDEISGEGTEHPWRRTEDADGALHIDVDPSDLAPATRQNETVFDFSVPIAVSFGIFTRRSNGSVHWRSPRFSCGQNRVALRAGCFVASCSMNRSASEDIVANSTLMDRGNDAAGFRYYIFEDCRYTLRCANPRHTIAVEMVVSRADASDNVTLVDEATGFLAQGYLQEQFTPVGNVFNSASLALTLATGYARRWSRSGAGWQTHYFGVRYIRGLCLNGRCPDNSTSGQVYAPGAPDTNLTIHTEDPRIGDGSGEQQGWMNQHCSWQLRCPAKTYPAALYSAHMRGPDATFTIDGVSFTPSWTSDTDHVVCYRGGCSVTVRSETRGFNGAYMRADAADASLLNVSLSNAFGAIEQKHASFTRGIGNWWYEGHAGTTRKLGTSVLLTCFSSRVESRPLVTVGGPTTYAVVRVEAPAVPRKGHSFFPRVFFANRLYQADARCADPAAVLFLSVTPRVTAPASHHGEPPSLGSDELGLISVAGRGAIVDVPEPWVGDFVDNRQSFAASAGEFFADRYPEDAFLAGAARLQASALFGELDTSSLFVPMRNATARVVFAPRHARYMTLALNASCYRHWCCSNATREHRAVSADRHRNTAGEYPLDAATSGSASCGPRTVNQRCPWELERGAAACPVTVGARRPQLVLDVTRGYRQHATAHSGASGNASSSVVETGPTWFSATDGLVVDFAGAQLHRNGSFVEDHVPGGVQTFRSPLRAAARCIACNASAFAVAVNPAAVARTHAGVPDALGVAFADATHTMSAVALSSPFHCVARAECPVGLHAVGVVTTRRPRAYFDAWNAPPIGTDVAFAFGDVPNDVTVVNATTTPPVRQRVVGALWVAAGAASAAVEAARVEDFSTGTTPVLPGVVSGGRRLELVLHSQPGTHSIDALREQWHVACAPSQCIARAAGRSNEDFDEGSAAQRLRPLTATTAAAGGSTGQQFVPRGTRAVFTPALLAVANQRCRLVLEVNCSAARCTVPVAAQLGPLAGYRGGVPRNATVFTDAAALAAMRAGLTASAQLQDMLPPSSAYATVAIEGESSNTSRLLPVNVATRRRDSVAVTLATTALAMGLTSAFPGVEVLVAPRTSTQSYPTPSATRTPPGTATRTSEESLTVSESDSRASASPSLVESGSATHAASVTGAEASATDSLSRPSASLSAGNGSETATEGGVSPTTSPSGTSGAVTVLSFVPGFITGHHVRGKYGGTIGVELQVVGDALDPAYHFDLDHESQRQPPPAPPPPTINASAAASSLPPEQVVTSGAELKQTTVFDSLRFTVADIDGRDYRPIGSLHWHLHRIVPDASVVRRVTATAITLRLRASKAYFFGREADAGAFETLRVAVADARITKLRRVPAAPAELRVVKADPSGLVPQLWTRTVAITVAATHLMPPLRGSAFGAASAARNLAQIALDDCDYTLDEPLDVYESPTGWSLGSGPLRYHVGAVVGNTVVSVAPFAACSVVATVAAATLRRPVDDVAARLFWIGGFPSLGLVVPLFLLQDTFVSAITVGYLWGTEWVEEPGVPVLELGWRVACIAAFPALWLGLIAWVAAFRQRRVREFAVPVPRPMRGPLRRFFYGDVEWIDRGPVPADAPSAGCLAAVPCCPADAPETDTRPALRRAQMTARWGSAFAAYAPRMVLVYPAVEVATTLVAAGAIARLFQPGGECGPLAGALVAIYGVYTALLLVLRPYLTAWDTGFAVVMGAAQVLGCAAYLVGSSTGSELLENAVELTALGTMVLGIAKSLMDVAVGSGSMQDHCARCTAEPTPEEEDEALVRGRGSMLVGAADDRRTAELRARMHALGVADDAAREVRLLRQEHRHAKHDDHVIAPPRREPKVPRRRASPNDYGVFPAVRPPHNACRPRHTATADVATAPEDRRHLHPRAVPYPLPERGLVEFLFPSSDDDDDGGGTTPVAAAAAAHSEQNRDYRVHATTTTTPDRHRRSMTAATTPPQFSRRPSVSTSASRALPHADEPVDEGALTPYWASVMAHGGSPATTTTATAANSMTALTVPHGASVVLQPNGKPGTSPGTPPRCSKNPLHWLGASADACPSVFAVVGVSAADRRPAARAHSSTSGTMSGRHREKRFRHRGPGGSVGDVRRQRVAAIDAAEADDFFYSGPPVRGATPQPTSSRPPPREGSSNARGTKRRQHLAALQPGDWEAL